MEKRFITTKELGFSALAIALATALSFIAPFKLPYGGSLTLCSMIFISLIGNWYGLKVGITAGVAYGLLQLVLGGSIYYPLQAVLDYPLAFGALGLSGIFYGKKNGLIIGYLVGAFGRYIFHSLSGYVFFAEYAPEGIPVIRYTLEYNATYIVPEVVLTLILISIPAVNKAFIRIREMSLVNVKG